MYRPQNIKELMPDKDWSVGVVECVEDEVNDDMMYVVLGQRCIWQDSLEVTHSIHFPLHSIVVVKEQAS